MTRTINMINRNTNTANADRKNVDTRDSSLFIMPKSHSNIATLIRNN